MKKLILVTSLAAIVGCASQPQSGPGANNEKKDRNNTAIGAVVGAVAGAVVGGQLDDDGNRDRGVIAGAVLGAAAGAGIGYKMDKQEEEFRTALEAEQRRSEIEIQRVKDDLIKLTFDSKVTFDIDSATVKASFYNSLNKVADIMSKYESYGTVVGHTDSTGSEEYNLRLSERRALSVQDFLVSRGVSASQLNAIGKGELEPRDSNVTEAGRANNRRVEFLVRGQ